MTTTTVEVDAGQDAGLPQLNFATYEEQLVWLFLSFVLLLVIVSKFALPRITSVLELREEAIAGDLDKAESMRAEAETVKASYEKAVAESRSNAQKVALETKEKIQAEIAAEQAKIDARLSAEADEAQAAINAERAAAMEGLNDLAADVTGALVSKLTGDEADDKSVQKAVQTVISAKGA